MNRDVLTITLGVHTELAHEPKVPIEVLCPARRHVGARPLRERGEDHNLVRGMAIHGGLCRKFSQEALSHESTNRFRTPAARAGSIRAEAAAR